MITVVYNINLRFSYIFEDHKCSDLYYNLMRILFLILDECNMLLWYKGYQPIPVYTCPNLPPAFAENILYCGSGSGGESGSGSGGKGKRKASIEDDENSNKKLIPEGGIPRVSADQAKDMNLKKLHEVTKELNETNEEFDSVQRDLKEVRQTITIDNSLSEDQKQKNNAMPGIKEKYPTFFDEDSGNTTDREGLNQVTEYLEDDLESLRKKRQNLMTKSRNYQSIIDWFNNNGKGGGSASGSSSGGFAGGGTSSSGPSPEQGNFKNSNNDNGYLETFTNKFLIFFSFFAEAISNNMDNFF